MGQDGLECRNISIKYWLRKSILVAAAQVREPYAAYGHRYQGSPSHTQHCGRSPRVLIDIYLAARGLIWTRRVFVNGHHILLAFSDNAAEKTRGFRRI